jgi:hypothetical protein
MLDRLDKPRPPLAGTEVGSRSKKQRMIAPLAKFIDWYALQVAAMLPFILQQGTFSGLFLDTNDVTSASKPSAT